MKVTVYTDGFFLRQVDVILTAQGQTQTIDLNVAGSITVKLKTRTNHDYHRPAGSLDTLLSRVGHESTYEITYSSTPQFQGSRYTLKYTDVQTTTTFDPEHSEVVREPFEMSAAGTPSELSFACEADVLDQYTNVGETSVIREFHHELIDGEIVIYLVGISYILRYDANGGQGAPGNQTYTPGQTVNLSNTLPTRRFRIFAGWDENQRAVNPTYRQGVLWRIVNAPARDIRLYAIWREPDWTYLPMRPAAGGNALLRSTRNMLIIRHGDAGAN